MKKLLWMFIVLAGCNLVSLQLSANIDLYAFSDDDKRLRYIELTKELRCPKCQNQDIADSNAPIATDMRREVHRLLEVGSSNQDIVNFMVERFGEFVSYKPKIKPETYLLWYGPWVLVILGLILIGFLARRRASNSQVIGESTGSDQANSAESKADRAGKQPESAGARNLPDQRKQVEQILSRYADDDSIER